MFFFMCYTWSHQRKSPHMTKQNTKLVGYARVSTDDQSVEVQIDRLLEAGVDKDYIFHENMSATVKSRPQLLKAMRILREGDTLVVWKFDRVARSISHLLEITEELDERKAKFVSLTEGVDTSSTVGRCFLMMIGVFAQLERDLIAERTQAGVDRARAKGIKFGAKHKVPMADMPKIWEDVKEKGVTMKSVAEKYGVVPQTIKRRLTEYEQSKIKEE